MGQRHTLVHQLMDWAAREPAKGAIFGKKPGGGWKEYAWREFYQAVRKTAKGLIALGHTEGDCVAIVGDNRPEWVICQLGIMAANGIPAPIYATNTQAQAAYIVSHSRAKIAICDNATQLAKYQAAMAEEQMSVEKIVTMDPIRGHGEGVMSLDELMALGDQQADAELDSRVGSIEADKTCLLIYTSGTTGVPKAVELTHEGMISVARSLIERAPYLEHEEYRSVSYLPLCHVAEQIFTTMLSLERGGQVYFCPDLKQVKDYLVEVRPTIFLGVPRVWEKFEAALRDKLGQATGVKASLARWALKTELASFKASLRAGREVGGVRRKMANKLVISKIKDALGLDQLKLAATGAAPISVSTQEFFASLGIVVLEGYGMSETSGVATVNDPDKPIFGSVGRALSCVEIKIAEDDEVLLKGVNMTRSYLHMPDETEELYTEDGWMHTGDLGRLDSEGNLYITGRKKDLIITAGGKNVAPTEIEDHIKRIPGVGQAVVVGDQQPYLCALVTLDSEKLGELCGELGISNGSVADVAQNPKTREFIEKRIESECNAKLARYQTVKKFEILPIEFTVDGGEMTPTMKLKRNVINDKYKDVIDGFYA
ncbi:MAG: long-chain fatty acid--CoA ligase [Myxococcales bacterium]|nr:long-chain fatty acid--CoA ligase [Myxococcales bacterium]